MASPSSSHDQQNLEYNDISPIDSASKRRKVCESSKLYDVFINHRGPDVKHSLATQLYDSLQQLGIEVFLDSLDKELGISFPSAIGSAIRSASANIPIFSKGYAESPWCLAELVLMLQSSAKIIPIFDGVKPSDLRYIETGVYAEAFIKYEKKNRYLQKLKEWKEALQSLSFIAGEEITGAWDCRNIVAAVRKEVQRKNCLHVATYPVGLDNLVEDFERRCLDELVEDFGHQGELEEGRHKGKIVGIFGMGGSGKTTLAKELYNRKSLNYQRASFLFDVREASLNCQLHSLQRKLLKDLFDDHELFFSSLEEGTSHLLERLRRNSCLSFLVVVDDIDRVEQLDALLIMDMLDKSSNHLIIVTTRDAGVLIAAGITVAYNLKGMGKSHARELFSWHAFGQAHPCSGYEVLVDNFVDVCEGLPLSLQILGRHVCGRASSYWSSELIKVNKAIRRDVKQTLRISFESLDDEQRQVFMDVACFFVGKPKSIAARVWEGSGWNSQYALQTLKDKCLVEEADILSLNNQEKHVLRMHDHLRDLGREIAVEFSPPRRLWRPQDLKSLELKGFKNILAKQNVRCFHSIFDQSMSSQITFFLGPPDACFETSPSLLWLELQDNLTELSSIPSWIPLRKLQSLKVKRGQLKALWEDCIQAPSQLKELEIFRTSLKEFPDFVGISDNLENVFLDAQGLPIQGLSLLESLSMKFFSLCLRFSTLKGEHASIKRGDRIVHESLVVLNFNFNGEVDWNNGKTQMDSLEKLEISGEEFVSKIIISGIHYPRLESIRFHCMENLMDVDLINVKKLNCLDIRNCQKLTRLAATCDLPNLVLFNISQCPELKQLSLGHLGYVEMISILDCKNSTGVSGTPDLRNLVDLKVKDCTDLVAFDNFNSLPGVSDLRMLTELNIRECSKIEELALGCLSRLEKIVIEKCNHLKKLSGISNLTKLVELELSDCEKLEFENLRFSGMNCLETIKFGKNVMVKYFELDGCPNLRTTKFCCARLVEFRIQDCPELKEMPAFIGPSCVERIIIDGCGEFDFLQLSGCRNLKSVSGNSEIRWLYICDCPELEELPNLATLSCLEQIEIKHCAKLQNITLPTTLVRLSIQSCRDLRKVAGTDNLTELVQFEISDCGKLEFEYSWDDKENAPSQLRELIITGTWSASFDRLPSAISYLNQLKRIALLGHTGREFGIKGLPEEFCDLQYLEHLELRHCTLLSSLPARFGDLRNLRHLDLCSCKDLRMLPVSFQQLKHLRHLDLSGCKRLVFQKDILENITELENLYLSGCLALQKIPDQITDQACLKELQLQRTILENLPNDIGQLSKLEVLTIGSPLLKSLPDSFGNLSSLRSLSITDCLALESLPKALVHLVHLEHLCLEATGVRSLPEGFLQLSNLRKLKISDCPLNDLDFGSVSSFSLENLTEINLSETLVTRISISEHCCPRLETLQLSKNDYLEVIEALPATVSKIELSECETLKSIKGIRALRIPPCLVISNCPKDFEEP